MTDQPTGEMPKITQAPEMGATNQPETNAAETVAISKVELETMKRALAEANKESATRRKALEALEAEKKQRAEAEMTETQRVTKRAEELEAKLRSYEMKETRREIANAVGLTDPRLIARLQGNTAEEIEADAKALLELQPKPQPTTKQPGPINPGVNAQAGETRAQKLARLTGTSIDPFAKGAGINWPSGPSEG